MKQIYRIATASPAQGYNIEWVRQEARSRWGATDANELNDGEQIAVYFREPDVIDEAELAVLLAEYDGTQKAQRQLKRERLGAALDVMTGEDFTDLQDKVANANSVPALREEVARLTALVEALVIERGIR